MSLLRIFLKPLIPPVAGLLLLLVVACSSPPETAPTGPTGSLSAQPEYGAIIVTQDLAVGSNRVVFGLVDRQGMPVRGDQAQVNALYLAPGDAPGELRSSGVGRFIKWPAGPQGVFIVTLELDKAGFWQLDVTTTTSDGTAVTAKGALQVKEKSDTPSLGAPAPRSITATSTEVDDLATITSSVAPDPDLYRLSVHQALDEGKPLVVVFATPAYCVSATCGPQVEVISQVKEKFSSRANFIHVEVFKDPHLIEGSRPTTDTVPAVAEWNLPTEPWTFVTDKNGRVHAKFEQFTAAEEIEAALAEVL